MTRSRTLLVTLALGLTGLAGVFGVAGVPIASARSVATPAATTPAATTPAATTPAVTAATAAAPRAELTGFSCTQALNPDNRVVSVASVMRPVSGTRDLAVKFDLLERIPGATGPATVVQGSGLGVWVTPAKPALVDLPGDSWQITKPVYDLPAPAAYIFRVLFRWTGATGQVIRTATKESPVCKQPELRPDLVVQAITVTALPQQPDKEQYAAVIANTGRTAAGPFEVLFTPGDNSAPATHTITLLKPGQSRTVTFAGPVCDPGSPPTVTADATDEVDVVTRAGATLTATCPATTTTTTTSATSTTTATSAGSGQPGTAHRRRYP